MEATFHRLLEAAGHPRNADECAGSEFFLTDLDYLDTMAWALGLTVEMVGDEEDEGDAAA